MLDEANAMAELNSMPNDEIDDLMNKYNTTNNSQIEDELATLKGNNIISDKSEIDNELAKLKEEK